MVRAPQKERLPGGLDGTRLLAGMPLCGRLGRGTDLSLSCSSLHRTITEARGRGSRWRPSRAQSRVESEDGTGSSKRDNPSSPSSQNSEKGSGGLKQVQASPLSPRNHFLPRRISFCSQNSAPWGLQR